ncbi:MAG TPA: efflux RND transporter permease subunit [Thermoleophilaceae bacterium]|nr:efflux RND transporter permease subunit [Thermoleophilaceae bacterium]
MTDQGRVMRWLVRSSLRFRWLVVFGAAAVMAYGVVETRNASVDVFPEFAPPMVEIQTIAVGNSSKQVEELITVPLEERLNGVEGLEEMRSKSVADLSSIELIFEPGTDLLRARQLVQERVTAATPELPRWASPPFMMPPLSATSRVLKIGLTSDDHSLTEMSMAAYWKIRQRLLRVPGVANVAIWGERLQQQQVHVDPRRLADHGVSIEKVMDVTGDALEAGLLQYSEGAVVGTGGFIETQGQRLDIRHNLPIATPSDLAEVPIERHNGRPLRLADVGRVVEGSQPLIGDAVINDRQGLMLIVQKYPGSNTLEVTRGVEEAMAGLRPGLPGWEVDTTIFRPATFIETALDNLTTAWILGVVLVALILVAFLFEWRTAFISLIAIPLSVVSALLVLHLTGATINVMVLAGLVVAIGVVVDDAIIDVENIVRRLRERPQEGSGRSTFAIVLEASVEVRTAITYATVINVVAIAPVLFLEGLSGSFFRPLALAYGLAVLVSMLVALTVSPALCLILLSGGRRHRESPLLRLVRRGYGELLSRSIRSPRPALVTTGVCFAAGLAVVPTLGESLLPNFKERDFLMHWLTKPGTSQPEETRISARACKDLRAIPGVRNCGAHIGQAFLADEVYGVDFGENWISVSPEVDYDKTLESVQSTVNSYPGLYRDVQTYLRERVKEVLTGTSESIVVRIFGPDLATLRRSADEVSQRLQGIEGVVDAHADLQEDVPHIEVEVDLAAARRHGIKPGDIRRQSAALVASEEVGDIFKNGRAYDVHVWSTPETRNSVTSIRELPIDTPGGEQVPLEEVADVRVTPTPNAIEREFQSRRIDVGANVQGRDLGSVVDEVEDRLDEVRFPREYHAEVLGESSELEGAQARLFGFGAAAAAAIFLLLQTAFRSVRLAILLFLTLPMALVGGALGALLSGGVLSLGSFVGFLTVFGIAARNGILMINHFQNLERFEGETFGPGLVLRGARERLAPILMTALATGLALVPLVIMGAIPGHEIEHPMAVVILGGLVTSTLLNLFILPPLYLRFGRGAHAGRAAPST